MKIELTKEETAAIEREAAGEYPDYPQVRINNIGEVQAYHEAKRQGWIAAATSYALKLKEEREWAGKLLDILEESEKYLSETLYEKGKPVQLNYIGAGSILHKKMTEVINKYKSTI